MDPFDPLNVRRMDRNFSGTAASRQKSCNACVRGKRRCDKAAPKCARCAAKGLDCVYQKVPPGASSPSSVTLAGVDSSTTATSSGGRPGLDLSMGGFDVGSCDLGAGSSAGTGTTSPGTFQLDPGLDFSIADLMGGNHTNSSSGGNLWSLPGFGEPKADFPAPVPIPPQGGQPLQPLRDVAILDKSKMEECITWADALLVHDPRSRVGFVVDFISKMHVSFARTRSLPFVHPRLYQSHLPRTMMSAFCAATAYANRTPATKAWTMRLLADAASEIVSEGRAATGVVDKLARVQALVLIDTMRVFDGDVSLRHAAEKERGLLVEWTHELASLREELEEGYTPANASRDRPPKSWDHWIFAESARRTVIMSMAFGCMMCILKSEIPDTDIWVEDQGFTASRHLWEASTSVDFFRAWREQPQWCIRDFAWREFWQYARAEDADEFTKIMLTTQVGPDAVDHFMQGETTIPAS